MQGSFAIALAEFVHVGGALVVIIAAVSVLTGIMREYIPQRKLQQKLAKHERRGSFLGASFGILTPFCSASVVPVSMGMAEMGISMGIIFSFLISAPLCNFVVTGMILAMFGWKVTLIYFVITFSSAVIAGFLMERSPLRNEIKRGAELVKEKKQSACGCGGAPVSAPSAAGCCGKTVPQMQEHPPKSGCAAVGATSCCADAAVPGINHKEKLLHGLSFAWALFKHIIPYVLIGSVISALSAAFLPAEIVEKYVGGNSWHSIPIAAFVGVPLYLRIEMAIPLLKVLIAKGMGMGAAMALVIGGTGASLPEIALVSSVLKPKAVVAFVLTIMTAAIIGGIVFQIVL
jgi:uncharacterized membrane protein YraQ (UPF0718 family)